MFFHKNAAYAWALFILCRYVLFDLIAIAFLAGTGILSGFGVCVALIYLLARFGVTRGVILLVEKGIGYDPTDWLPDPDETARQHQGHVVTRR